MTTPLLIGGATTSAPAHGGEDRAGLRTAHRARARRLAGGRRGVQPAQRRPEAGVRRGQPRASRTRCATQHANRAERPLLPYAQARANRLTLDFASAPPPAPAFTGRRQVDVDLSAIVPFIDWTFFFSAWELKGRFPAILDDPRHGAAARELYDHAQKLLTRIVEGKLLRARGVYGFWPANSDGDDIVIFDSRRPTTAARRDFSPGRAAPRFTACCRQQEVIADGKPNRSLADFVAPVESGVTDYVGAFAVTAGLGCDALVKKFEAQHDDYTAIMVKALADRLAEAFAEYLHAQARRDWGYGAGEQLSTEDLAAERYRGIRPAFGYPACPDHTREGDAVRPARRARHRHGPHRVVRDDTGRQRVGPLLRAPAGEVLRHPAHRPRPGGRLRPPQGHHGGRGREVAAAGSGLRTGARHGLITYGPRRTRRTRRR